MFFWSLPKLYYCHGGLVKETWPNDSIKKTNQKNLVKIVESKLTCPKWQFGQIGQEGKKTIGGVFLNKIHGHKNCDFL
jgi:hypothetical protein